MRNRRPFYGGEDVKPETIEMKAEAIQIIAEKLVPSEDVFIYLGSAE